MRGAEPAWAGDVTALFAAADVDADRKPDVADWLRVHFAQAAGMIGAAPYAGGQQQLLEDQAAVRDLAVPAVRECFAVLAASGVDPAAWPDATPYLTLPAGDIAAGAARSAGTPWVQRTFRAGHFCENLAEMKRFYGDVLATGRRLGVAMPVMESFEERIAAL